MGNLQLILTVVGAISFLWFALPFVRNGILNIGNITGMAVFGSMLLYGIYYVKCNEYLLWIWNETYGRTIICVLAVFAVLIAAVVITETVFMIKAAVNYPPENTTAVLLGCSVKGTKPSSTLMERINAAAVYLKENKNALCILSGGKGPGEDISEAECMYRCLVKQGIEKERLLMEDKSVTTEENLRLIKGILNAQGLGRRITIVTSEFHAFRAGIMAKKIGLESFSTPSRTKLFYLPTYYGRELYGILFYLFTK